MHHGRAVWGLVVTTLVASVVTTVPLASPTAAADPWIDTSDRNAVLSAWRAEFDRTEPAMAFSGDVAKCVAGSTSQAYRDSVLQRVNWYRRMAGVGTVTENTAFSNHNQQTALMMSAEGNLSHTPGSEWACRTADGAAAAGKSNLALGIAGVDAIDAYMQDFGASNTEVGHRRTILYPQLQEIGTGDIPFGPSSWASNSLYVFDAHLWDPRPDVRENRDFVAWPPPGYVPAETVWGRWSFSLARADFSSAAVSVKGPDGPVHVDILERVQSGGLMAPEAAIVFAVDGDTNSAVFETPTNGDECYEVSISGVTMSGSPVDVFSYATCLIDPSQKVESNQSVDRRVTPNPVDAEPASGDTENCLDLRFSAWTTPCWAVGTPQNLPFADVTTSWQLDPVGWMVANDITTGVTPDRFDPNGLVTRAQAATFIWRMAGQPAPPGDAPIFRDVPAGTWFEDAVRWMAATGITTGTSATEFSPDAIATRAHLTAFLWRLVDEPDTGDARQFHDVTALWQHGPVGWAASAGVTIGTSDTTFDPELPVTRGQAAAMIARTADAVAREAHT